MLFLHFFLFMFVVLCVLACVLSAQLGLAATPERVKQQIDQTERDMSMEDEAAMR